MPSSPNREGQRNDVDPVGVPDTSPIARDASDEHTEVVMAAALEVEPPMLPKPETAAETVLSSAPDRELVEQSLLCSLG